MRQDNIQVQVCHLQYYKINKTDLKKDHNHERSLTFLNNSALDNWTKNNNTMTEKLFIRLTSALLLLCFTGTSHSEEIHREAPQCTLTPLNNSQTFNLQQFKGKVVYVDFWASWCGPCAQSFPFMNNLDRDLKDQGLQVIGVNLDENIDEAKQFLDKRPASFITAVDAEQQCAKNFDVKAMPSSYLIDRKGVIRHVHLGFRPGEAEEFRILVEQLLAEKPVAP